MNRVYVRLMYFVLIFFVVMGLTSDCAAPLLGKEDNMSIDYSEIRYDEQLKHYSLEIEKDPGNANAYVFRGYLRHNKKQYGDAISDFTKALEIEENNSDALSGRGVSLLLIGEINLALKDIDAFLAINPQVIEMLMIRAGVLFDLNDYGKAIDDYDKVISISPEFADAYVMRGYSKERKGEMSDSIKDFKKAQDIAIENDYVFSRDIYPGGLNDILDKNILVVKELLKQGDFFESKRTVDHLFVF